MYSGARAHSSRLSFSFQATWPIAGPNTAQLPDGPGKATVQKICSGCHAPEIVLRTSRHERWLGANCQ